MKVLVALLCMVPAQALAQSWWTVEARLGTAFSLGTALEIEQQNQPQIRLDAEYETRPFEDAPYYGLRAGWRNPGGGWEIEFLHHKIYLNNNPQEVQHFEVSHGYNLLMLNRVWNLQGYDLRTGGGVVISHTESTIRNLPLSSGQEVSGIVGQAGLGRNFYFSSRFYFGVEGKFTFAHSTVSVADGEAKVPNIAIHVLAGLGYDLTSK